MLLTPFDIKRLDSYSNNMLDYHVILDLLPTIAGWYFEKRLGEEVQLSALQSSILLALGSQRKTVEDVEVNNKGSFPDFLYSNCAVVGGIERPCVTSSGVIRKSDEENRETTTGYSKSSN